MTEVFNPKIGTQKLKFQRLTVEKEQDEEYLRRRKVFDQKLKLQGNNSSHG